MRFRHKESLDKWQRLAGIQGEANTYRDEARYWVVQIKRGRASTSEERESLIPEMRELSDTASERWRDRILVELAITLEDLERIEEAAETWDRLAVGRRGWARKHARKRAQVVRARKHLGPGNPAPDFSAVTTEGEEISLAQFQGSVLVLVFEHVWNFERSGGVALAEYVRRELPQEGIVVIGIVWTPSNERVARAARRKELACKVVADSPGTAGHRLFRLFGVDDRALYLYVLDRGGTVAARGHVGRLEEMFRAAERLLEGEARAE